MTTTFTAWESFVLAGIAAVFAYHIWIGWRTRIARFPMSLLVFQEFERDQSPENFWGVMVVNTVGLTVALFVAAFVAWGAFGESAKPVAGAQSLNGCYEG